MTEAIVKEVEVMYEVTCAPAKLPDGEPPDVVLPSEGTYIAKYKLVGFAATDEYLYWTWRLEKFVE